MTTLYKKVGRRYRPVAEHEEWDSYPKGAHLVVCSPGSTMRRFNIDPDRAGLLAAAEPLREQIRALVVDLHKMRPTRRPVTMQQAAAWRKFQKAMGNDGYVVEYASVGEIADAVVDLIVGAKQCPPPPCNCAHNGERMKHFHGTPIGGTRQDAARFLMGRHALVPSPRQDDMGAVAEVCQSFIFDNGAFSAWKRGEVLDVPGYMAWVRDWCRHPGFEWALIPDVIDGDEQANDVLISQFEDADLGRYGVPVWHMHESLDRLARLCDEWPTVALGSSGQWATPGTERWWQRMSEAMDVACDDQGRPFARLHGLRMMDPEIFTRLPLASADSTNAAVNGGSISRFGSYVPPTAGQRAAVIAERIEAQNSAAVWRRRPQQSAMELI